MAERKRQLVSNELTDAALQLLALRGFDAVTIDDIVAAAGVSQRTFFRYFRSKEDVVVQFLVGMGADISAGLTARPDAEPPSLALRHAVWVPIAACAEHPDRTLSVVKLILDTPALLARFLERQEQWRGDLATRLASRPGLAASSEVYLQMAARMALAAFDAVLQQWSDSGGTENLADLTDQAFAVIAPALDTVRTSP